MLLKVVSPVLTPLTLATQTVKGGLLYSRVGRSHRVQELINGGEYSRGVREFIPREDNSTWKTRRVQRVSYSAGRTVRPGRPPPQKTSKVGIFRPYPEGLGVLLDGEPAVSSYWERKFYRQPKSAGPQGVPHLEVFHRGGVKFESWATKVGPSRLGGYQAWPSWGFQPRREQDPLRGVYAWFHRGGSSCLGALRGRNYSRGEQLTHRLGCLLRRRREHQIVDTHLERLREYRHLHWGRRRNRLPVQEQRFFLFRRRRLRGYLTGDVSHRNYIRRITRRGFYRWHSNRWARLEKATLLGSSYYEARSLWSTYLLGSRVATPLEYNLYNPSTGFGRLVKRRRLGARRWKLGQHIIWGEPFKKFRQARWSWFHETPLGALVKSYQSNTSSKNKLPLSITEAGLRGAVYWSAQKWGRSRWERPQGRQVTGFIWSLKGGQIIELESQQWGKAGTSGTGIFLSLVTEHELRHQWNPYKTIKMNHVTSLKGSPNLLKRLLSFMVKVVKFSIWGLLYAGWSFFVLFWSVYSWVAISLCYVGWRIRQVWFFMIAVIKFIPALVVEFLYRQLTLPAWAWITHWVKDTPLAKTLGWVWTSWVLVYSSGDDQSGLDVPTVIELNETTQERYMDEVDDELEEYPDDDLDLEYTPHVGTTRALPDESWNLNFDFTVHDMLEGVDNFFYQEVFYRVGFFIQPFMDFCVRLPIWGFLEGVSLLILAIKLEYQRFWSDLLRRGGSTKGRWWKIPLILTRMAVGLFLWLTLIWVAGSTLSYSTIRLEVVLWGLPWREEYYLLWWLLIIAAATKVVGPSGVKNFLFTEVGWSNLLGLFWGVTEVVQPEEYYPGRPRAVATQVVIQTVGMPMRREKNYDDVNAILKEDDVYLGGSTNVGFDEIGYILAQKYETGDNASWEELDEINYFGFPLHLAHSLDQEYNTPYKWDHSSAPGNELRNRAWREPHLARNNYYEATFQNLGGRTSWDHYFQHQNGDYRPFGGTPEFSTRRDLYSNDESFIPYEGLQNETSESN